MEATSDNFQGREGTSLLLNIKSCIIVKSYVNCVVTDSGFLVEDSLDSLIGI